MNVRQLVANTFKSELLRINLDGMLIVFGSVAFFSILRYMLWPFMGNDAPYMLFFIAISIATIRSGAFAGALATVLSASAGSYLIRAHSSVSFTSGSHIFTLVLFVSEGLILVALAEVFRRNRGHAKEVDLMAMSMSKALKNTELKLYHLMQSNVVGTVFYNYDGRLLECNDAFLHMLGYTRKEMESGKLSWMSLTPPDVIEKDYERFPHQRASGGFSFEKEYLHKDGHRVPVFVAASDYEAGSQEGLAFVIDLSELKRTQRALAKAEERHQLATTLGGMGTWEWSIPEDRLVWSDVLFKLYGITERPEQMGADYFLRCIIPEDREAVLEKVNTVIEKKMEYYDEFRIALPDGEIRWIAARGRALYDESGNVTRMAGVNYDITRRKVAEEALARSEEKATLSTSLTGIGLWEYSPEQKEVIWASEQLIRLWGFDPKKGIPTQLQFSQAVHIDDRETLRKLYDPANSDFDFQFRIVLPNGKYRWIISRGRRTQTSPDRVVGVSFDVTAAKEAEEALALSEERYQMATSLASIGTWDLTVGQDAVFSKVEKRLFGWDENEVITEEKFYSAVHPDDVSELKRSLSAAVKAGLDINTEFRIVHSDGKIRWLAMRGRALFDADGRPHRMLGVNYDITEHKQVLEALREGEAQMEKALREAQAANQMKDQFLATLSHELRTPLNAILGWAELSQTMDRNSDLFNKAIETIYRNAKLQTEMINDLLDVARILNGKFSIAVQEVELTDIIMDAVESCRLSAQAKQINVSINIESEDLRVLGDPNRLQQILWNLLSNGIKFTPKAGEVTVNAKRLDSMIEIRVEDTGEGIPSDFLPYVFDRFRQADASTARKHGGLGLGLAIVRHLIELHGGTVRAQSAGNGKGACFQILLPVAPKMTASMPNPQPIRKTSDISLTGKEELIGRRILVVDDVEDSLELVGEVLSSAGVKVRLASSAKDAMALIESEAFDLLVTDLGMPERDGFSLLRDVREHEAKKGLARLPVIALTAYARESDLQKTKAAGFDAHLAKPVSPNELYKAISKVIGERENQDRGLNLAR